MIELFKKVISLLNSAQKKFERIKEVFNVNIKPTLKNLKKLKLKQIPLNGKEKKVANDPK